MTPGRDRTGPTASTETLVARTLHGLRWQLRLARGGLLAERLARAFWPAWTILLLALAAAAFGVPRALPPPGAEAMAAAAALGVLAALVRGLWRFRWPTAAEAVERLDRRLPGRPFAALADRQAIGVDDPAAVAVWQAHLARMAARARAAQAPAPDLRLASRDRLALRYVALTALVAALLFGSFGRIGSLGGLSGGAGGAAAAAGPAWEGWVRPPAYTGRPTIYLTDLREPRLVLPEGSRVLLRFYGEPGAMALVETVSAPPEARGEAAPPAAGGAPGVAEFEVARSGRIEVTGTGGRRWEVAMLPDAPPSISFQGELGREAGGRMRQAFRASDDHGVVAGRAEIRLDLAAVDRRHGLAPEPEPREALVLDLPMPVTGARTDVTEALNENLSEHPWSNLPVTITLYALDARRQEGRSETIRAVLPGRRFFDPLAAALIEMRRDLLWSREDAARVARILRAVSHRPEGFVRSERAYLMLRVAITRLEAGLAGGALAPDLRDEIAAALWEIATLVEAGDLASALERMRRAQDRLSEAMRNGADPSEIEELMNELREAMRDYMRQLAEQGPQERDGDQADGGDRMEMTGRQLRDLLDRLQDLMEQGRMDEAAELMEMLRQLMENMQVTQGPGGEGEGEGGEGGQAMRDLAETLRRQRDLSDDTFRDLQDRFNPGRRGDPSRRDPGQGEGTGGEALSDRQRALREELRRQAEGRMPGEGSEAGDAAREALDRAGRAMREAEEALREGDGGRALDRQSEALEAMREGLRSMGEAMAEEQRERAGERGEATRRADPRGARDPLGREAGTSGRLGTEESLLQGEDVYRRAQDLLEELRRRSGDQGRPEVELDYLRRLLDRF